MITYFALNGSFDLVPAQLATAIVLDLVILIILSGIAYIVSVEIKESRVHKEQMDLVLRSGSLRNVAHVTNHHN